MGYRIKIGMIPKAEKEKYAGKTYKQIASMLKKEGIIEEDYFNVYNIPNYKELYELGKYVSYKVKKTPFFDFNTEKVLESEFYIITKDSLKQIIEIMRKENYDYFKELSDPKNKFKLDLFLRNRVSEWGDKWYKPYYLDEPKENRDGFLVNSWCLDYAIFNLVYIYNTFDFENNYLLYVGW